MRSRWSLPSTPRTDGSDRPQSRQGATQPPSRLSRRFSDALNDETGRRRSLDQGWTHSVAQHRRENHGRRSWVVQEGYGAFSLVPFCVPLMLLSTLADFPLLVMRTGQGRTDSRRELRLSRAHAVLQRRSPHRCVASLFPLVLGRVLIFLLCSGQSYAGVGRVSSSLAAQARSELVLTSLFFAGSPSLRPSRLPVSSFVPTSKLSAFHLRLVLGPRETLVVPPVSMERLFSQNRFQSSASSAVDTDSVSHTTCSVCCPVDDGCSVKEE